MNFFIKILYKKCYLKIYNLKLKKFIFKTFEISKIKSNKMNQRRASNKLKQR